MKIPKFILFNFLTNTFIRQIDRTSLINRRLKTALMDFALTLAIFFPYIVIVQILGVFLFSTGVLIGYSLNSLQILGFVIFTIAIIFIINKDIINGRSISKRIYGYQIVDFKTKKKASELKCLIRNITIPIYPIEFLFLLFSPNRRLGDILSGTELVDAQILDKESILEDMENYQINDIPKLILYTILICILYGIINFGLLEILN